ncbi:MAG: PIN domain-containing protein [Candidatus Margulisbacteria bacterium]|nr:PIN domain-containing protein [Candidatus Margulisiibacteriota bacterium]
MLVTEQAVNLYRRLRKRGATIRASADCLIAAYALLADIPILHKDRDFKQIAQNSALRIYK